MRKPRGQDCTDRGAQESRAVLRLRSVLAEHQIDCLYMDIENAVQNLTSFTDADSIDTD